MKRSYSKFNLSIAILGLVLVGGLLLPGASTAMASMDSSKCPQQISCNICISADIPEIQSIERDHPVLNRIQIVPQAMETLSTPPASPPPKN